MRTSVMTLAMSAWIVAGAGTPSVDGQTHRPAAMTVVSSETPAAALIVVGQRTGLLTEIALIDLSVVKEQRVVREPRAVRSLSNGDVLLIDGKTDTLSQWSRSADGWVERTRIKVAADPVSLLVHSSERRCYVGSRWSARVTIVELDTDGQLADESSMVDVPFAVRQLEVVPQVSQSGREWLIAADAFGGRLAMIDDGRLVHEREIPAHNISALKVLPENRLAVTHQVLNRLARTTRDDVHWGIVLSNNVRTLQVRALEDPQGNVLRGNQIQQLDDVGHGAADPTDMLVLPDGVLAVTLGGGNEVAIGQVERHSFRRVEVGRSPSALVDHDGRLFVANAFDDTVSIVDSGSARALNTIRLGATLTGETDVKPISVGEMLFFDAKLSHDGWMSCHSCHTDGHSSQQRNDNLGDGTFGAPKRVLSLGGVANTAPWAWDGHVDKLEEQIRKSIGSTMQGDGPTDEQVAALTSYIRTIPPPPSRLRLRGNVDEASVQRGKEMFLRLECRQCHRPPTYTSAQTYDVGLQDELGKKKFNPPSLRGVSQRAAYFHDARATSLESVFRDHKHQLQQQLSDAEIADLVTYLRSL